MKRRGARSAGKQGQTAGRKRKGVEEKVKDEENDNGPVNTNEEEGKVATTWKKRRSSRVTRSAKKEAEEQEEEEARGEPDDEDEDQDDDGKRKKPGRRKSSPTKKRPRKTGNAKKGKRTSSSSTSGNAEDDAAEMSWEQVRWLRLLKNGLVKVDGFANASNSRLPLSPEDVAKRVVGVQAQELAAAFIAIWNRICPPRYEPDEEEVNPPEKSADEDEGADPTGDAKGKEAAKDVSGDNEEEEEEDQDNGSETKSEEGTDGDSAGTNTNTILMTDLEHLLSNTRSLLRVWSQRGTLHLFRLDDWPIMSAALRADGETTYERQMRRADGESGLVKYQATVAKLGKAMLEDKTCRGFTKADLKSLGIEGGDLVTDRGIFFDLAVKGEIVRAGFRKVQKEGTGTSKPKKTKKKNDENDSGEDKGGMARFVHRANWVPDFVWQPPEPNDANLELMRMYLRGYGPATADDFAHWRGTKLTSARKWMATLQKYGEVATVRVGDATMFVLADELVALRQQVCLAQISGKRTDCTICRSRLLKTNGRWS
jgi:hypothetical protein